MTENQSNHDDVTKLKYPNPTYSGVTSPLQETVVVLERIFRYAVPVAVLDSEEAQRVASLRLAKHLDTASPSDDAVTPMGSRERVAAVVHNERTLEQLRWPDRYPSEPVQAKVDGLREFEQQYRSRLVNFLEAQLKFVKGDGHWVSD